MMLGSKGISFVCEEDLKMRDAVKKRVACLLVMAMALSTTLTSSMGKTDAASAVRVKSVKVSNVKKGRLTLEKGKSFQLKVKVKVLPNKSKYKKVNYVSSKKKIAAVSVKGKIKAKKVGTANISVISKKDKKKKAVIKVTVKKNAQEGDTSIVTPPPADVTKLPADTPAAPTGTPSQAESSPANTPVPTDKPTASPTTTPPAVPTQKPDGTSALSRRPFAGTAYVGDTLADVSIDGGSILDSNGNEIQGTYTWVNPDVPLTEAGRAQYAAKFVPEDKMFAEIGDIRIRVLTEKRRVILTLPKASAITTSQSLEASVLTGGKAVDMAGKAVEGTFSWIDGTAIPGEKGIKRCGVIFTPKDTATYRAEAGCVSVKVTGTPNSQVTGGTNIRNSSSLKAFLSGTFGKVGTALVGFEMNDSTAVNFSKSQFNSVTMGNEMKPDFIFKNSGWDGENHCWKPALETHNPSGYVDTASFTYQYRDTSYPVIDMDAIDSYIKTAYQNGMKMRYHVFIWHTQTPKWFFKENFSTDGTSRYVSPEVMNGRLEYMIRNVMTHIYNLQDEKGTYIGREVIDSWDIANEYFHNYDKDCKSSWDEVYYPDYKFQLNQHSGILTPVYIKEAFALAYSILEDFHLEDSVKLMSNDFNTYMVADQIVAMIQYFNTKDEINPEGKQICSGVGMQMHLDMGYPTVEGIRNDAIRKFKDAGFEIEITEFDLTDYTKSEESQQNQAFRWYDLMVMLQQEKDQGAKITGITWWGPSDTHSWRKDGVPLLFSNYGQAKKHYNQVLEAVSDYNENAVE